MGSTRMEDSTDVVFAILPNSVTHSIEDALSAAGYDVLVRTATPPPEPAAIADAVAGEAVDAIVYGPAESTGLPEAVRELRERRPGTPIVAVHRDEGATAGQTLQVGASAVVRATGDVDDWLPVLEHRLERAIDGSAVDETEQSISTGSADVERLNDLSSRLDEQTRESDIYRLAVSSAEELLGFDACAIVEVRDGAFVPLAATAREPQVGRRRLQTDEGIAGEAFRSGTPVRVNDVRTHPNARLGSVPYRSVLAAPIGDFGVFQVLSKTVAAYEESDLELAELLVDHVEHALERVRYEATVERERDHFAALFQNIQDAAVNYTFEGEVPTIEHVNSAFVRLFGFDPEDAIGESTLDLLVPEDERESARAVYAAVGDGDRIDAEVTRMTADGLNPFLLRSVPVSGEGDEKTGYLIYTDIGELKDRERELQRKNERLESFTSIVSHDLRNPLSSAQGYVDLALETDELDHLTVVQKEHQRMLDMIDDLLTLAREGETIGETSPTDVAEVARNAWATVDTKSATVSIGDLPTVEGDPDRLQQLFENLFRNAVTHGGPDVTVTIDEFERGFSVADDGPGIPDEQKDEVFKMGMTTASDEGGTGFGLAIVTDIASAHGWSVEVTDARSGGARFDFFVDEPPIEEDSDHVPPT